MGNPFGWLKSKLLNFGSFSLGRQLSIISVVTLLLFLPIAVWLTLQPTRPFSRAYLPTTPPTEPGGATAVLSIDPELAFVALGQEVRLNVNIDAGTHEVTAADVILTFDKEIVSVEEIIPGDFLPVPLGKMLIDNETGKVQFAVGEQPSSLKKGGTGTLAIMRVKSKGKTGSSPFEFGDGTAVTAVGWDTTVLSHTLPGVVQVDQQTGTSVSILLKFQGVNTQRQGQVISYTAASTKSEGDSFKGETMAVGDTNGLYRAVLSSVSPGTYDFTVKGPAHLSAFLGRHTIPISGEYTIDISDKPLIAGDIAPPARDDRISIIDYSLMVTHFGPGYPDGGTPADLDFDGDVDIFDYNMIVSNFGKTGDLYAGGPNCPQVITPAKNPTTGECRDFSTPCDVPEGWDKVSACGQKNVGAFNMSATNTNTSLVCKRGDVNCSYQSNIKIVNRTDKTLYNTTLYTSNQSGWGTKVEYTDFKGNLTSGQSKTDRILKPGDGITTFIKVSPSTNLPGQWTGLFYADAQTCNLIDQDPPGDCYYYGASAFTVRITVEE